MFELPHQKEIVMARNEGAEFISPTWGNYYQ
ncbi:hypothetical protein BHECKSOX_2435 [Bathymodiolus heckerae thiotrophic gill symbiont]|nr:hypothetical protein BHECKSOX_2435 [Bathymodiolus heckerae thiotrophic gill symbiont]